MTYNLEDFDKLERDYNNAVRVNRSLNKLKDKQFLWNEEKYDKIQFLLKENMELRTRIIELERKISKLIGAS